MLNYLYAILEAQTRIALLTVGLDPGLGLLHADQTARDSLARMVSRPVIITLTLDDGSEAVGEAVPVEYDRGWR